MKSFFIDHPQQQQLQHHPPPPKPALSEHSTSNPTSSSDHSRFHPAPIPPAMYSAVDPPPDTSAPNNHMDEDDDVDDDDEEADSDSEAETARNSRPMSAAAATAAEPSELMQLEMSEDIRVGSPDDGSNNLDSDFHLLAVSHTGNPSDHERRSDSYRAESTRRWDDQGLQLPASGKVTVR